MRMKVTRLQQDWHFITLALIFSSIILCKMMLLHAVMNIRTNLMQITLTNFSTLMILYLVVFIITPSRWFGVFVSLHIALSSLVFINTVYYSHFFTLVPASSVFQMGQIGGVTDSILALIKPVYLLYYIDTVVLWYRYRLLNLTTTRYELRRSKVYMGVLLILVSGMILSLVNISQKTEGHLTPVNLGMLNYHVVDILGFFRPSIVDPKITEEAVVEVIEEEEDLKWQGLLAGRNIIVIQAESLQAFVIGREINDQEITPMLNRISQTDSFVFENFYEQVGWGNTSDAEFISHNSFYASTKTFSYKAYENNTFRTLPMLLKESNYTTMVMHGNDPEFWQRRNAYEGQGIDRFYSSTEFDMNQVIGMGLSDEELFHQSIKWLKATPTPFYAMYITLTSHHPFELEDHYKSLVMPDVYQDTMLGNYLHAVHYLDKAIEGFIHQLKQEGLYESSAIVIYGDHQALDMRNEEANQEMSRFLDKPYTEEEMFKVPLIIHIPGSRIQEKVTTAGGQIDFFPTMANLIGKPIEPDKVMGKDLLNIQEGFVAKQVHVAAGSFIDNEKIFIMSPDGIYENSRAWKLNSGEGIPLKDCREGYDRAMAEVALSEYILQNDLVVELNEMGLQGILDDIRLMLKMEDTEE